MYVEGVINGLKGRITNFIMSDAVIMVISGMWNSRVGAMRTAEPYVLEDALNNNGSVHRLDLDVSDPSQIQNMLVKFLPIVVDKLDRTGKKFYLFII